MNVFDNPAEFIVAALEARVNGPDCPICGSPVVLLGQGGINTDTGEAHSCVLAFLASDEGEAFRATVAEENRQSCTEHRPELDKQGAADFADVIMAADTVDDLLR